MALESGKILDSFGGVQNFHSQYITVLVVVENDARFHLIRESKFSLAASEIIKNLGWDRRTDIPKHKLLLEVASAAYILDCLLVKSTWIEGCKPILWF